MSREHKGETPVVLAVAGFDPSGGAGIIADTKTIIHFGCQPAAAISHYERALVLNPELPDYHMNLGCALFHLGEPRKAQALHREALAGYQRIQSVEGIVWALETKSCPLSTCSLKNS